MVNYLEATLIRMVHFTRFFPNTIWGWAVLLMLQGWRTRNCNGLNLTASVLRLSGQYGVIDGPYVQLPFYGSFTLRDDGDIADGSLPGSFLADLADVCG